MANCTLTDEELWKKVEEDRLREERLREPCLIAFRATQQEIEIRKAEDAREAPFGDVNLWRWAEGIARSAREAVRFERYLVREGFFPQIAKDDPLEVER